jgi:hypothetical protein
LKPLLVINGQSAPCESGRPRRGPLAGLQLRLLATLLHYANAAPPFALRREFYALKERLLRSHGDFVGTRVQRIDKPCWGDRDIDGERRGCIGPGCSRCDGTGLFDRFYVTLEEFRFGRFTFHIPRDRTAIRPEGGAQIIGRIQHSRYGLRSREAALWLYLLCGEWRLFIRALRASCVLSPGWFSWQGWWPLLNLNRIVFALSMRLRVARCWCGRRFMTWGSGWCICRRCRKKGRMNTTAWTEPF